MDSHTSKAMRGAGGQPLSGEQKRNVCMLAREAWLKLGRPGFDDQAADVPECMRLKAREALEIWRQDEQRAACGCSHLTAAANRMYPELMAHFCALAGREREAQRWSERTAGDERRQADAKLAREMEKAADVIERPRDYMAAICRSKYTCTLEECSPGQLWKLVYDLRRAAAHRREKARGRV